MDDSSADRRASLTLGQVRDSRLNLNLERFGVFKEIIYGSIHFPEGSSSGHFRVLKLAPNFS